MLLLLTESSRPERPDHSPTPGYVTASTDISNVLDRYIRTLRMPVITRETNYIIRIHVVTLTNSLLWTPKTGDESGKKYTGICTNKYTGIYSNKYTEIYSNKYTRIYSNKYAKYLGA
jgi:hypothetical protein